MEPKTEEVIMVAALSAYLARWVCRQLLLLVVKVSTWTHKSTIDVEVCGGKICLSKSPRVWASSTGKSSGRLAVYFRNVTALPSTVE